MISEAFVEVNEGCAIGETILEAEQTFADLADTEHEMLEVHDGSCGETTGLARIADAQLPWLPLNAGDGAAHMARIAASDGIFTFDADSTHLVGPDLNRLRNSSSFTPFPTPAHAKIEELLASALAPYYGRVGSTMVRSSQDVLRTVPCIVRVPHAITAQRSFSLYPCSL